MELSPTLARIRELFSEGILTTHSYVGDDTVVVAKSHLLEIAKALRDDPKLRFDFLIDVTAVDNWKRKPRFEVVYHLLSHEGNARLRVKVPVGEPDPEVDTLSALWPAADWYEREVFDMFGISFKGHPNLCRILMYPEFEGHPLRKDYPIKKRQPLVGPKD